MTRRKVDFLKVDTGDEITDEIIETIIVNQCVAKELLQSLPKKSRILVPVLIAGSIGEWERLKKLRGKVAAGHPPSVQ